ncbi:hypothetical protein B484DRAFT_484248 [Ochromonadaceae sp. CCMP2298]|nr:hypothetical protein B484DRAFT_484248 [Ochromonadaceae sp. CCMP2298]
MATNDAPFSALRVRKLARQLYYRKRHLDLTSNDQVACRDSKRLIWTQICAKGSPFYKQREFFVRISMVSYLGAVVEPPEEALRAQPNKHRTIESFCAGDCRMYFRFLKPELHYLFELLDFPPMVRLRNRSWQTGEEIFLRGICGIATGMQQDHLANLLFGGVGSDQSLAFNWFLRNQAPENAFAADVDAAGGAVMGVVEAWLDAEVEVAAIVVTDIDYPEAASILSSFGSPQQAPVTISLSAAGGRLSLPRRPQGLALQEGQGKQDRRLVLRGPLDGVNVALTVLPYGLPLG